MLLDRLAISVDCGVEDVTYILRLGTAWCHKSWTDHALKCNIIRFSQIVNQLLGITDSSFIIISLNSTNTPKISIILSV